MIEAKEMIEVRTRLVKKSNELIQKGRFNLSVQEQRVVLFLISKIKPWDEDFKEYSFTVAEFCKVCGLDPNNGGNYKQIKAVIKSLRDKSIWGLTQNGEETLLSWIEKPYLDKKKGTIRIRFDQDMKPFLLFLLENYTSYELIWTLRFRSKYSIRLYEYIKSIHYNERSEYQRELSLSEFRAVTGAEQYTQWKNLNARVLQPALREINAFSDKNIDFETVLNKNKVVGIRFSISTKNPYQKAKLYNYLSKDLGFNQLIFEGFEDMYK